MTMTVVDMVFSFLVVLLLISDSDPSDAPGLDPNIALACHSSSCD